MTKYYDGDDDGDNDGDQDGKKYDNAASRSGYNGTISNPITTPRSRLGIIEEDRATIPTALQPWRTTYLCVGL